MFNLSNHRPLTVEANPKGNIGGYIAEDLKVIPDTFRSADEVYRIFRLQIMQQENPRLWPVGGIPESEQCLTSEYLHGCSLPLEVSLIN